MLSASCSTPYGAHVFIENVDSVSLTAVKVQVTGATYPLGTIPPGETRSIKTYPTGETGVIIQLANPDGQAPDSQATDATDGQATDGQATDSQATASEPITLDAGSYFEPGYRDTLKVQITHDTVVETHQGF
ncbi:MAG: hypothetical protein AAGF01_26455 [Cyanobacteria bacterium P01_G01_bin.38]